MPAAGVDIKIVQDTLGHVTSAYTRDTYTSVYPQLAQDAAENTAALIRMHPVSSDQQTTSKHGRPTNDPKIAQ
jgi:hypothetical protein